MATLKLQVEIGNTRYLADVNHPLDISIPLRHGRQNPNAWQARTPAFTPVKAGGQLAAVNQGSPVNFFDVAFNPHGNGTHTECVGHIAPEQFAINRALGNRFFAARLVSISPQSDGNDLVIAREQIQPLLSSDIEALIIRTLPNVSGKKQQQYTGTNPPFIAKEAMSHIVEAGIQHLLIDTPSVDKESDGGELAAHKTFWRYPAKPRMEATITELIFVPGEIEDGLYLLNIQIPPMMLDAAPSRPYLFPLQKTTA